MLPKSTAGAIRVLLPLHVAAGVVGALLVEPSSERTVAAAFFSIVVAQAGLLGILLGLGTQAFRMRLLEATAGLLLPCSLMVYADSGEAWIICGLLATNTFVVAGVLGVLRRRGLGLRELAVAEPVSSVEPLRFGIRHLMVWILATAVLLRIGQLLDHDRTLGILFSYGLTFTAVSVATPWAALGRRRPWLRSALVVLVAGLSGMVGPIYQQRFASADLIFFASMTAFDAVILLASLGTLRRCGLRLVRDDRMTPQRDIVGSTEPL